MFQIPPLPRTIEAARRDLESHKPDVRADAARDLGQPREPAELDARVELLARALGDGSPLVRKAAVLALADLNAKEVVPTLLGLLADPDLRVRQMVVLAVGELAESDDAEVLGRLLGLTRAGDPAIRFQALSALAGLARADAREEILAAASDPDAEIRELAARLIAEHLVPVFGVEPALEAVLRTLTRDATPRVALSAEIEALSLGIDVGHVHLLALLQGKLRPSEAADDRRAIDLCAKWEILAAMPALRRRAFGWLGVSLDPYRWQIRATLARLGDTRAIRAIKAGIERGRWLRRTLAVEAAGAAQLVELGPRLERLRGRAELVDQDVLEHTLLALAGAR